MLKLTIPIIIQNLLSAAVNSADVIMLNYVGQSAISAVSLAANYSNILFMVYYGLGTGASLLCAQYFGKNNMQAIHAIEGIALRFSIIISGIVALIAFTAPQLMMKDFYFYQGTDLYRFFFILGLWELHISAGELQRFIWRFYAVSDV